MLQRSAFWTLESGQFTFIDLVDKTNYYHFLGIAPPMQHHSFFRNSTPSSNWFFRIFLCLFAGVVVDKLPKVHWLFFVEIDWSHWWLFMDNYVRFTFYLNPLFDKLRSIFSFCWQFTINECGGWFSVISVMISTVLYFLSDLHFETFVNMYLLVNLKWLVFSG